MCGVNHRWSSDDDEYQPGAGARDDNDEPITTGGVTDDIKGWDTRITGKQRWGNNVGCDNRGRGMMTQDIRPK